MFVSFLPPVVCKSIYVLSTLFVFVYNGVLHILCCVFLCLVYPMLPVSLGCPFSIAPSVFSNLYIYIQFILNLRCSIMQDGL